MREYTRMSRMSAERFLECKTWMTSKMGKRNWMNNLLFHMFDTTMMRTWRDKKAYLGLERLSNQGWKDEWPTFCYLFFYNERLFPLANPIEPRWIPSLYPCQEITPYTRGMLLRDDDSKGLPSTLGAYSKIGEGQSYARGKFCGWMIEVCEDDL